MCRMLAFVSSAPRPLAPWIDRLARLSSEGILVERWARHPGGNHPDGWGVAVLPDGPGAPRIVRGAMPAHADPALPPLGSVAASRFIGHARFASNRSSVCEANAHPFAVEGVVLAHNGTFRGAIGAEGDARGVSDSLVFLERLAARWPAGRTFEGLAETLREILSDEAETGDYSAANFLAAEGGRLFAFRKSRRDHRYYALHLREAPGELAVASERLGEDAGWREIAEGELVEMSLPAPRSTVVPLR
jgi:predicted glutamine amidotransferase